MLLQFEDSKDSHPSSLCILEGCECVWFDNCGFGIHAKFTVREVNKFTTTTRQQIHNFANSKTQTHFCCHVTMSQESQLAPDIVSDIDEYGNAFSLAASDTQSPLLSQLDLATLTAPLSPLMIVSASASPTPSSPSTLASSSAPPSPRPQPAQQLINPYHSCCMHSYRPSPAPYHEQDILYTVPLPTPKNPDNELTVVVHPRWCPTCSMQRMQFLEDRTEEELVSAEKGQKLYPSQEESAFRIGVRSVSSHFLFCGCYLNLEWTTDKPTGSKSSNRPLTRSSGPRDSTRGPSPLQHRVSGSKSLFPSWYVPPLSLLYPPLLSLPHH